MWWTYFDVQNRIKSNWKVVTHWKPSISRVMPCCSGKDKNVVSKYNYLKMCLIIFYKWILKSINTLLQHTLHFVQTRRLRIIIYNLNMCKCINIISKFYLTQLTWALTITNICNRIISSKNVCRFAFLLSGKSQSLISSWWPLGQVSSTKCQMSAKQKDN